MKGSTVGSRVEGSGSHGGFHGVVSHGMPALVKAPDFSSHARRRDWFFFLNRDPREKRGLCSLGKTGIRILSLAVSFFGTRVRSTFFRHDSW